MLYEVITLSARRAEQRACRRNPVELQRRQLQRIDHRARQRPLQIRGHADAHLTRRITSYNVCYTKLLRIGQCGVACLGRLAGQCKSKGQQVAARNADDAHPATTWGRGDGGDGVLLHTSGFRVVGRLAAGFHHARDLPLLGDRQDVVNHPVEHP